MCSDSIRANEKDGVIYNLCPNREKRKANFQVWELFVWKLIGMEEKIIKYIIK